MKEDKIIELLIEMIKTIYNEDVKISIGNAYHFIRIKKKLAELGIDLTNIL